MLTKAEQKENRSTLFRHLDGIVVAPTLFALFEKGVTEFLLEKESVELSVITEKFKANEGYLNVALRILCSQGWLEQDLNNGNDTIRYSTNERSSIVFQHAWLYRDVVELLRFSGNFHPRKFEIEPFRVLEKIIAQYNKGYGLEPSTNDHVNAIRRQMLCHIEGIMVGPTTVHLGMNGMFHKYFMEASFRPEEYHSDPESFRKLLDMFTQLGWFGEKNGNYKFLEKGLFFARRASAYGVTVSYIPTLRRLDELIFGNADLLRETSKGETEQHVDRAMNVWGSGGAHAGYFNVLDEIIIDIFNRPINEQPRGILDMGCGNGAFLEHVFTVIEHQTARGKMLEEYPLFMVGADYNQEALKITKANLIKADIWAKVIWGDIGRPDLLAEDLKENYNIDLHELLNVRTFLDHNRIWKAPVHESPGRVSTSTGAFAHRGKRISNNLVEDSLLEHLKTWQPYVKKFGLLVIELHTVPPSTVAAALGNTAATAYDATHGYSDQYILEVEVFNKIATEAGLPPDPKFFRKFPDSSLATVSINLLKGTN